MRTQLDTASPQFAEFKRVSGLFRRGQLECAEYFAHLEKAFGLQGMSGFFMQMMALLPDAGQRASMVELYTAKVHNHNMLVGGASGDVRLASEAPVAVQDRARASLERERAELQRGREQELQRVRSESERPADTSANPHLYPTLAGGGSGGRGGGADWRGGPAGDGRRYDLASGNAPVAGDFPSLGGKSKKKPSLGLGSALPAGRGIGRGGRGGGWGDASAAPPEPAPQFKGKRNKKGEVTISLFGGERDYRGGR